MMLLSLMVYGKLGIVFLRKLIALGTSASIVDVKCVVVVESVMMVVIKCYC